MSYTEIFGFERNGDAVMLGEVRNSWRGAMAVWNYLDEKYLPPFIPDWAVMPGDAEKTFYRTADRSQYAVREIWALIDSGRLSKSEKIVLGTTFDNVVVMKKDFDMLLKAFREFGGETSLKEQADIIEQAIQSDDSIIAVAWNQTSVNSDTWCNHDYDAVKDEPVPYNILKNNSHWDLFSELETDKQECS